MGLYDRDYIRDRPSPSTSWQGGGSATGRVGTMDLLPAVRSVTFWLLVINVSVFLLDYVFLRKVVIQLDSGGQIDTAPIISGLGFFSITTAFEHFQLWRLVTFQFLHAHFPHLFANMLGLFFFGPLVENVMGSRRFLVFYLLCGFGGVAGYVLLWAWGFHELPAWGALVGASAGIMGILIAAARFAPNLTVLLFLIIPLKLRTVALLALGYGIYIVVTNGNNVGGEAGHLGGAAVGALLVWFPSLLSWVEPKREPMKLHVPQPRSRADNAEVDRVLAKIGTHGPNSLTESERATLAQATRDRGGV